MTTDLPEPKMNETIEELQQSMLHHQHRMQAGIGVMLSQDGEAETPKHVRVGINTALVETGVLGRLLIDKGIITELEYFALIRDGYKAEADGYEEKLGVKLGSLY